MATSLFWMRTGPLLVQPSAICRPQLISRCENFFSGVKRANDELVYFDSHQREKYLFTWQKSLSM